MGLHLMIPWIGIGAFVFCVAAAMAAESDHLWLTKVRSDHPRLFFNKDSWPEVKAQTLGPARAYYSVLKRRVDRYPSDPQGHSGGPAFDGDSHIAGKAYKMAIAKPAREWGAQAMQTAFVYLMTGDKRYLEKAKKMLEVSVGVYHQCYRERRSVNWYSTTRVCALAAYDWIYNDLTPEERRAIIVPLLKHIDDVQPGRGKPAIHRRNSGTSCRDGFYGVSNLVWFAGLAAHGDALCDEMAFKLLKQGYAYNQKLFSYRKFCAGDDGGLASATVGYAMGAYPWSQINFLYTWRSAMNENIAPQWPHLAYYPIWVMWNWIPGKGGRPLGFGYGDTPHYTNALPQWQLYGHMSQIMHLYGQSHPDCAAVAACIRERCARKRFSSTWPIYPFLTVELDEAPKPFDPASMKLYARHFESLGQVIMRSGWGAEDTYCLFTVGGRVSSHKHYDEGNFVIYKKGHLALDSGSRGNERDFNLRHYYAQTVAHNCVLIHMPDEPLPRYWGQRYDGSEGKTNYGGMDKQIGSKVVAFATNDQYTYVAGDATPCYSDRKCKLALRQFVFVMPDHFVICDRVISAKPEYRKEWLLHTQNEPEVEGMRFQADEGGGRLFCRTLLPKDAALAKIGGPGKEFWANGMNWELNDAVKAKHEKQKKKTGKGMLWGNWRVEVSPGEARTHNTFLHFIHVGEQSLDAMAPAKLIEREGVVGVNFEAGEKSVEVVFGTADEASGHIKIAARGRVLTDRDLTQQVMPQTGLGLAEER